MAKLSYEKTFESANTDDVRMTITGRASLACLEFGQQHGNGVITLGDCVFEALDGLLQFFDGGDVLFMTLLGLAFQLVVLPDEFLVTFRDVTQLLQALLVFLKEYIVEEWNQVMTKFLDEHPQYEKGDKVVLLSFRSSFMESKVVLVLLATISEKDNGVFSSVEKQSPEVLEVRRIAAFGIFLHLVVHTVEITSDVIHR